MPADGVPPAWWHSEVLSPSNGTIQRYPPGARYDEHTDSNWLGTDWSSPRTFTAIVYAHEGWHPGHGGELSVFPPGYKPGTHTYASTYADAHPPMVVEPRSGTLALFPAHAIHAVAPVVGTQRYAVTVWLSLRDRVKAADSVGGRLAHKLTSTAWIDAIATFRESFERPTPARPLPPGTIVANQTLDLATKRVGLEALQGPARSQAHLVDE